MFLNFRSDPDFFFNGSEDPDPIKMVGIQNTGLLRHLSKLGDSCIFILLNQVLHLLPGQIRAVH